MTASPYAGCRNIADVVNVMLGETRLQRAARIVRAHENLEDQAPTDPECGSCNMGTGPHRKTCEYHAARALLARAEGK